MRPPSDRPLIDPVVPLIATGFPPLVLLVTADPLAAVAALAVALAAALYTHATTRRPTHAFAAAALALLFLPADPVPILAPAALLLLLATVQVTRLPYLLTLAAPAFLSPDPSGPWLAATALAVLAAVPAPRDTASTVRTYGGPVIAALLLTVGAAFALLPAVIGLLAGFAARLVVHHPARHRLAAGLGRAGLWGALLPAFLLFLMAALGRLPVLGVRELLLVGWATVGLGGLAAAVVLGIEVGLRSSGQAPARAAAVPLAALGVPAALVATGALTAAAHLAGLAWALIAPAAVLGVLRLARATGRFAPLVGVATAVIALLALPIRLLY